MTNAWCFGGPILCIANIIVHVNFSGIRVPFSSFSNRDALIMKCFNKITHQMPSVISGWRVHSLMNKLTYVLLRVYTALFKNYNVLSWNLTHSIFKFLRSIVFLSVGQITFFQKTDFISSSKTLLGQWLENLYITDLNQFVCVSYKCQSVK